MPAISLGLSAATPQVTSAQLQNQDDPGETQTRSGPLRAPGDVIGLQSETLMSFGLGRFTNFLQRICNDGIRNVA